MTRTPSSTTLATLTYVALTGIVALTGLQMVTRTMTWFSHTELELMVSWLTYATALAFVVYMWLAWWRSNEHQITSFSGDTRRNLLVLLAALGIYLSEALLWFALSDLLKPFWVGSNGGTLFIVSLFLGALYGVLAFARWYHQLVWPRSPH